MLSQIRQYGVADERVLGAMAIVDREKFVPDEYKYLAYEDRPLPIGYGQTISQPYTVARMIELLIKDAKWQSDKATKILEIGTGCGYQTAVLAKLYKKVYSIEIVGELSRVAEKNLRELGRCRPSAVTNYELRVGDGKKGWKEYAPYDGIIVAADANKIPRALIEQLKIGGRMVVPVKGIMIRVTRWQSNKATEEKFGEFNFVPLV